MGSPRSSVREHCPDLHQRFKIMELIRILMVEQSNVSEGTGDFPGEGKSVTILGVPLSFGQSMAGVDLGPGAIRVAGLARRIEKLGYRVEDLGDLPLERPRTLPAAGEKVKYLKEIHTACE